MGLVEAGEIIDLGACVSIQAEFPRKDIKCTAKRIPWNDNCLFPSPRLDRATIWTSLASSEPMAIRHDDNVVGEPPENGSLFVRDETGRPGGPEATRAQLTGAFHDGPPNFTGRRE
ncbi:hypothetical protein TWF217_000860 [Orbilia oligospora]|nr:hypothetical protein TWF217_000860 [Orbilia oligospora]KAF3281327.1 hypothetical protein TWF132_011323 [Orbilia oligospora]